MTGELSQPERRSPLRVGLIGSGKMGLQHLKAIASLPDTKIVGIADPAANEETLRPLIPSDAIIVADAATMLAEAKPDVVHIVTPPATHAALARAALEAGCHVYVEKPFTRTVGEAEQVLDLANRRGLNVAAGHQYLFERPALLAAEMLPDIGRVVHIESFFSFRMVRRTITPVDQCKDILPHAVYPLVDQLRQATGVPEGSVETLAIDARATGDVYALVRLGDCLGLLDVTLSGRPIEQYQHFVGTNGSLRADYIVGSVIRLIGPGAGLGVLFTPYRRAFKTLGLATRGFAGLIFGRTTSYPGLRLLIERFYRSIAERTAPPMSQRSIIDTVAICERIGNALDAVERDAEQIARAQLTAAESTLPPIDENRGVVLVTGGTGMLGRPVVKELRHAGCRVRAVARRVPPYSQRVPGVDYVAADLGRAIDPEIMRDVDVVAHCAAETAGGKSEHERNSIAATRNVIEAAAAAGVKRLIQVSSLAVLRRVRGRLDEGTPVDVGNLGRGPYVWGKAESEALARELGAARGIDVKVLRPGPLVDYTNFSPPGRLGREVGPFYVAVGGRGSELSVCDVWTAARVIRSYVTNFAEAPATLNMVEGKPPTRRELVARLRATRPDLSVLWFPGWLLRLLNGPMKLAQRILLRSSKPIDVYGAFASERYRTDLALRTIERAGASAVRD